MLFVFDWDGTISDSASKIIACMQQSSQRAGVVAQSDEAVKNIIGLGLPEAIAMLYPGISAQKAELIRKGYSEFFAQADATPSAFFPGVADTLAALRARGHILTVATGKSRKGLNRVLGRLGLDGFFHGSRCADETASKPDPRMLQELLVEFDVDASDAVMVGDTEYDMSMAQQAGVPRIAVSFGAHHIDRLKQYKPVLCVDAFSQILEWSEAASLAE